MSIFTKVKVKQPKRTKFDLSHYKKLSGNMGDLLPIGLIPIMPGDKISWSTELLIKLSPLVVPTMERFKATVHYFFVPNRLVWDNWEDFITGGEQGTLTPEHPYYQITDTNYLASEWQTGGLADYMGIPPQTAFTPATTFRVNALPFRGYAMIYNEYYRDQNLTLEVPVETTDGLDNITARDVQKRAWYKDYFTSALPWAQRGAEVLLPFDDINYKTISEVKQPSGVPAELGNVASDASGLLTSEVIGVPANARIENIDTIGAPTINELRKAYRLQEWLENNARGGARYVEQILAHFGVRFSDYRAQRPIFLGSGSSDILVSEILNTTGIVQQSADVEGNVQGGYAGNAMTVGRSNGFKHSFQEHGFIHALLSVQPSRATYFQGVNRMWTTFDKLDYPFPEFANLGEQPILNQELYWDQGTAPETNAQTFGYTPRYAEFKDGSVYTTISGDFRENLDVWHYARKFASRPALNTDFIEYSNDKRIFNIIDPSEDTLYIQAFNRISAIRPLPYFGTPRT